MKPLLAISLLLILSAGSAEAATTICMDGRCFTCDGSVNCNNSRCTCNGQAVPESSYFPQRKKDRPKREKKKQQ